MLLTPRIVRTHGLTQEDLDPIHIGTQQNIGLSGPPALIAAPPLEPAAAGPDASAEPSTVPLGTQPMPTVSPGTAPLPGMATPVVTPAPAVDPLPAAEVDPVAVPIGSPAADRSERARVLVTLPGTDFRIGGGPYTVPISVTGVSRLSTVTMSLTYDPNTLRVRSVQEGSFMRQGGLAVTFTQSVDGSVGRVDLTLVRTADPTGASGSGLLAAVLFDAVAAGSAPLTLSGVGTSPGGDVVPLAFTPVAVSVR